MNTSMIISCRTHSKNYVMYKNYHGQTTSLENPIWKYLNCDCGLNSCPCSNPELPPMWSFASLYVLIRHTFVCATLFPALKLI
jgi:hypothetical protein